MGKYANCIILNREQDIFDLFWSREDDICLSFNDGAYVGAEAVSGYYKACWQRNKLVASLMQARFPEQLGGKSEEEIYGVGPFKVKPLSSPVIEVAVDGMRPPRACGTARAPITTWRPAARWPTEPGATLRWTSSAPRTAGSCGT